MVRKSPRSGHSGKWPSPITGAKPTWQQSRREFSRMRRRASRSPVCRWAAISPSPCCGWRPSASELALLDTSARPDTPEQTAGRKTQIVLAQTGRYGEIPDLSIPRYLNAKHQRDERLTTIVRQMVMETGPEAFVRQLLAIMSRPDSRPLLASIRCPTLVLVGDADIATPPELNKEIAAGIPGAKLTIVPDCGHLSTLEQPEAVNAALAEWLGA
jgi:pimeloyl-ACP methyl ester carboxylesterase